MNLGVGRTYYFVNKHTRDIDCLTVVETYDDYFVFDYKDGESKKNKRFSVSYKYAAPKLFPSLEDLLRYQENTFEEDIPDEIEYYAQEQRKDEEGESWDYYFNPDYDGEDYDGFGLIE